MRESRGSAIEELHCCTSLDAERGQQRATQYHPGLRPRTISYKHVETAEGQRPSISAEQRLLDVRRRPWRLRYILQQLDRNLLLAPLPLHPSPPPSAGELRSSEHLSLLLRAGDAPVTKALCAVTVSSSILLQVARAARRPVPAYIAAFEHAFVFSHPGELLFGTGLLYYSRLFERQVTCSRGAQPLPADSALHAAASALAHSATQSSRVTLRHTGWRHHAGKPHVVVT